MSIKFSKFNVRKRNRIKSVKGTVSVAQTSQNKVVGCSQGLGIDNFLGDGRRNRTSRTLEELQRNPRSSSISTG